jgi:hypothetical protein
MKGRTIGYWTATGLTALVFVGGVGTVERRDGASRR